MVNSKNISLWLLFLVAKETFFVQSIPSILMSNNNLSFNFIQTSHRGWSTAQKYVQNPLVPRITSFGCYGNFFCPIYYFLLMSNKNLSFNFIQTSHRGWSTAQKYVQNPLVPRITSFGCYGNFFCPIYSFHSDER